MTASHEQPEPGLARGRRQWLARFDRILTGIEDGAIIVCYVALISIVGIETIRRFVLKEQAPWGPEIAIYAFIWLSWFAASKNIVENKHLAFTALRERCAPFVRKLLEVLDCLIWIGIGAIIVYGSYSVVETNIRFNQTVFGTNIPVAAASAAVPVAWSFAMIRVAQRLYFLFSGQQARVEQIALGDLR